MAREGLSSASASTAVRRPHGRPRRVMINLLAVVQVPEYLAEMGLRFSDAICGHVIRYERVALIRVVTTCYHVACNATLDDARCRSPRSDCGWITAIWRTNAGHPPA